jgi:hypothetical protein
VAWRKLSAVNLHHQACADVQRLLTAHGTWLSGFRGVLDLGVQDAGGYWEIPNVDFVAMDACVRSGHVRQFAAGLAGQLAGCQSPLRLRVTSFAGLHLYTPAGERMRTRSWPRSRRTGLLLQPSAYEQPLLLEDDLYLDGSLFGPVYEISVLMDIDLGTKTLRKASLAAIDWGEDDKGREIYYEEEIPPPPMASFGGSGPGGMVPGPASGAQVDDGFSDLLDEEGDETGTDPA